MLFSPAKGFFILALLLFTCAAAIARHRLEFAPGPSNTDRAVDGWMKTHRAPALTAAARVLSQAGTVWAAVAIGVAIALTSRRPFSPVFPVIAAVAIAAAVVLCPPLKTQFACGRPDPAGFLTVAKGFGFPSQHALLGAVGWGLAFVAFLRLPVRRSWKIAGGAFTAALVAIVAVSRVYLSVHWLSDVLFGVTLALGWLFVSMGYEGLIERGRRLTRPPEIHST